VAARMAEHQCATREVCSGDHGWQPTVSGEPARASAGRNRWRMGPYYR
jgi:hypothetical protein